MTSWVDAALAFTWGAGGTAAVLALWAIAMELGRIRRTLHAATRQTDQRSTSYQRPP